MLSMNTSKKGEAGFILLELSGYINLVDYFA